MPLVALWMVPPVQVEAVEMHVPPVPVTVRPPLDPVLLRMIPLDAPFEEILLNVSPLDPIVVLETLSATPLVDAIVELCVSTAVATAPLPPPALKATSGADVYPLPP